MRTHLMYLWIVISAVTSHHCTAADNSLEAVDEHNYEMLETLFEKSYVQLGKLVVQQLRSLPRNNQLDEHQYLAAYEEFAIVLAKNCQRSERLNKPPEKRKSLPEWVTIMCTKINVDLNKPEPTKIIFLKRISP